MTVGRLVEEKYRMLMEQTIDRESQQKLYVQIYSLLKEKIEKGDWPAGAQISTEDELCKVYDVSKATIRIAISELVRAGYLVKRQGKGTFITYSSTSNPGLNMKTRLSEDIFGVGVDVKKEVMAKGVREPSVEVMSVLKSQENVFYVLCKRTVGDQPAYIEELFFPLDVFPGIESEDICRASFYNLIQNRAARKVSKVIQTTEFTEISGDAAKILRVKNGSPAILLHRLLVCSKGGPIAYNRLVWSGKNYKIRTEFEKLM